MRCLTLVMVVACTTGINWLFTIAEERGVNRNTAVHAATDVIRAKRFELVDDEGRVRLEVHLDDDHPEITFRDAGGSERFTLFQNSDATGLAISDPSGHTRIGLAQFGHGGGVAMHGENGKGSAIFVLMNGEARQEIHDDEGNLLYRWPKNEGKDPQQTP